MDGDGLRQDRLGAESAERPSETWRSNSEPRFWEISDKIALFGRGAIVFFLYNEDR
jgi:hypothetical protein